MSSIRCFLVAIAVFLLISSIQEVEAAPRKRKERPPNDPEDGGGTSSTSRRKKGPREVNVQKVEPEHFRSNVQRLTAKPADNSHSNRSQMISFDQHELNIHQTAVQYDGTGMNWPQQGQQFPVDGGLPSIHGYPAAMEIQNEFGHPEHSHLLMPFVPEHSELPEQWVQMQHTAVSSPPRNQGTSRSQQSMNELASRRHGKSPMVFQLMSAGHQQPNIGIHHQAPPVPAPVQETLPSNTPYQDAILISDDDESPADEQPYTSTAAQQASHQRRNSNRRRNASHQHQTLHNTGAAGPSAQQQSVGAHNSAPPLTGPSTATSLVPPPTRQPLQRLFPLSTTKTLTITPDHVKFKRIAAASESWEAEIHIRNNTLKPQKYEVQCIEKKHNGTFSVLNGLYRIEPAASAVLLAKHEVTVRLSSLPNDTLYVHWGQVMFIVNASAEDNHWKQEAELDVIWI